MDNSAFVGSIFAKLQSSDLDIYDKSGFNRFRLVDSDAGQSVKVWHNGNYVSETPIQDVRENIEKRLNKGLSDQTDFIFV